MPKNDDFVQRQSKNPLMPKVDQEEIVSVRGSRLSGDTFWFSLGILMTVFILYLIFGILLLFFLN